VLTFVAEDVSIDPAAPFGGSSASSEQPANAQIQRTVLRDAPRNFRTDMGKWRARPPSWRTHRQRCSVTRPFCSSAWPSWTLTSQWSSLARARCVAAGRRATARGDRETAPVDPRVARLFRQRASATSQRHAASASDRQSALQRGVSAPKSRDGDLQHGQATLLVRQVNLAERSRTSRATTSSASVDQRANGVDGSPCEIGWSSSGVATWT